MLIHPHTRAFTLLEMSIVLVIIGLITGSVLVGRDIIDGAKTNATIAQIQKYQSATAAFHDQYSALPGDMPQKLVTAFNFATVPSRNGSFGRGDGNGVIEGYDYANSVINDTIQSGETAWFWEDLTSNAKIIEGAFNYASDAALSSSSLMAQPAAGTAGVPSVLPVAKLGGGNFIYVFSSNSTNYYGISGITSLQSAGIATTPGLSVVQANRIDSKIDDGLPQSGTVIAQYIQSNTVVPVGATGTAQTPGSATTCYDNANTTGATQQYSLEQRGGKNFNCALSFQFP